MRATAQIRTQIEAHFLNILSLGSFDNAVSIVNKLSSDNLEQSEKLTKFPDAALIVINYSSVSSSLVIK